VDSGILWENNYLAEVGTNTFCSLPHFWHVIRVERVNSTLLPVGMNPRSLQHPSRSRHRGLLQK